MVEADMTVKRCAEIAAPLDELRLSVEHLHLLRGQVASALPHEVCGFLGGVGREVKTVLPVPNIAPDPRRQFVMDPRSQWQAMRALSERGWNMVAIYHSHPPGGPPEPSESDIAMAHYPEALYLVIVPSPLGRISSLRAFAIEAGRVCGVSIAITS